MLSTPATLKFLPKCLIIIVLIITGLDAGVYVEADSIGKENTEQTSEIFDDVMAICERKVSIKKATFLIRNSQPPVRYTFLSRHLSYENIRPPKTSRPILHRAILI